MSLQPPLDPFVQMSQCFSVVLCSPLVLFLSAAAAAAAGSTGALHTGMPGSPFPPPDCPTGGDNETKVYI